MSDRSYSPVQQAMKKLQDPSRNEEDRYRALAREGRQEGRKATRARLVTRRFGLLPHRVDTRLQQATPALVAFCRAEPDQEAWHLLCLPYR